MHKDVWAKFASTSTEIIKLLKLFDEAYEQLHNPATKWEDIKKQASQINEADWKAGLGPEPSLNLADKYQEFLKKYMQEILTKSATNMKDLKEYLGGVYKDDKRYKDITGKIDTEYNW